MVSDLNCGKREMKWTVCLEWNYAKYSRLD